MIYLLVGIPGSGKSTFCKKLKEELNCEVISTDQVRNEHPDWDESKVWPEVYQRAAKAVEEQRDAIFDATNTTPKVRKRFVDEVEKYGVRVKLSAYYFDTPWEVCYERVLVRNTLPGERFLPPEVVESYGKNIIKPTLDEGFEAIYVCKDNKIVEVIK